MLTSLHHFLCRHLLLFCLIGVLTLSASDAFLCDVYLNGASQPSLTFGQGYTQTDYILPAPPFSAMFGVADTFLVNRMAETNTAPDLLRLAKDYTQIITAGNRWVIASGVFTRTLTFAPHADTTSLPDSLYLVYHIKHTPHETCI